MIQNQKDEATLKTQLPRLTLSSDEEGQQDIILFEHQSPPDDARLPPVIIPKLSLSTGKNKKKKTAKKEKEGEEKETKSMHRKHRRRRPVSDRPMYSATEEKAMEYNERRRRRGSAPALTAFAPSQFEIESWEGPSTPRDRLRRSSEPIYPHSRASSISMKKRRTRSWQRFPGTKRHGRCCRASVPRRT